LAGVVEAAPVLLLEDAHVFLSIFSGVSRMNDLLGSIKGILARKGELQVAKFWW